MILNKILQTQREKFGQKIGTSHWHVLDQQRISEFSEITGDDQFIHVDPIAAAKSRFGGTVAHGFLTLSLCVKMASEALELLPGQTISINYGFEKIRFLTPVPSGGAVRGHFTLQDIKMRTQDQLLQTFDLEIELKGGDKSAIIATWLVLAVFE